jgi:hypothetical protein
MLASLQPQDFFMPATGCFVVNAGYHFSLKLKVWPSSPLLLGAMVLF